MPFIPAPLIANAGIPIGGQVRSTPMTDVTRVLVDFEAGDAKAAEELLPLVYDELGKQMIYVVLVW
jgi:ECF sigma factor